MVFSLAFCLFVRCFVSFLLYFDLGRLIDLANTYWVPLTKTNTILSSPVASSQWQQQCKIARTITICRALAQPFVLIISIVFLNSHHLQSMRQYPLHVGEKEFWIWVTHPRLSSEERSRRATKIRLLPRWKFHFRFLTSYKQLYFYTQPVWAWTAVVIHLWFPVFNSDGCLQRVEPWRELREKEGEKKPCNSQCSPVPRTVGWLTRALRSAKATLCFRPML